MSKWHALEGVTHNGESLAGIDVIRWPRVVLSSETVALSDDLADPDGELLNHAQVALLPQGGAWGTPDGAALDEGSNLWKFLRAIAEPFADAYRDLWRVAMESTSVSIQSSLEDWEQDYGLPNPCFGSDQSVATRLKWLRFKVISAGTISPGDFLNLANEVGSSIIIEEPEFFELGYSDLGGPDELGGPDVEHLVIVWPVNSAEYGFTFGDSELGKTPVYDFDDDQLLECVFPDLLCAGYQMFFNYSYANEFLQE